MRAPLSIPATITVLLVALLHICFAVLEMGFWTKDIGLEVFDMTLQEAETSKVLAANQGLYNGFLAAGLLWGLMSRKRDVILFFLLCVIVAGAFGAYTAKPTILFVQALPAAIAAFLVWFSPKSPS